MSRAPTITPSTRSNFEKVAGTLFGVQPPPLTTRPLLRYPGGKSRAATTIAKLIPAGTRQICSPFIGGGSVELVCAGEGIRVYGADGFKPLVEFWKFAINNPALLSERVRLHYPLTRSKFYTLQKSYTQYDSALERAAVFYVLNRSSFSGTTLSGGMSPGHPRFTLSSINRLQNFHTKGLSVACADFRMTLARHNDKFLYLDPPYANGGKLYGKQGDMHDGFAHAELAEILKQRDGWILSYNDCQLIRKLYKKYKFIHPKWAYGMSNKKVSNEVLIVNT